MPPPTERPAGALAGPPGAQAADVPAVAFASWGRRFVAAIVDTLVYLAIWVVVFGVAFGVIVALGGEPDEAAAGAYLLNIPLGFVISAVYPLLTMRRAGQRNGQTLGKQALRIRVVRTNRRPLGAGPILLRELVLKSVLFGFIGAFTLFIATLLDYLWPLWDDEHRALHDMLASTRVVGVAR